MQPLNLQPTLPIQQSSFDTSCFLIISSSEHFPAPPSPHQIYWDAMLKASFHTSPSQATPSSLA